MIDHGERTLSLAELLADLTDVRRKIDRALALGLHLGERDWALLDTARANVAQAIVQIESAAKR